MSLTISGVIITILSFVFTPQEAETLVGSIAKAIDAIGPAIGILMTYWGRYRQGDITWYGKKAV